VTPRTPPLVPFGDAQPKKPAPFRGGFFVVLRRIHGIAIRLRNASAAEVYHGKNTIAALSDERIGMARIGRYVNFNQRPPTPPPANTLKSPPAKFA
jgi:hypothetical protein